MPKYGVHHIVLANATNALQENELPAADILINNPDMAMVGAIGPDLFFWAPDYPYVKYLMPIYRGINEFVLAYEMAVKPINDVIDAVGGAIEDALPATYGINELFVEQLQATIDAVQQTLTTSGLSAALGGINLITDAASIPSFLGTVFDAFKPPRQIGDLEQQWYWFDMLHYRNTGDFARRLVDAASSDKQRAYAYGYLSHIATDLTGHPYVNQIVGGPFRTHVQRHVVVENFIDSWAFREYFNESVNQTLMERLALEKLAVLPDEIVELLGNAFQGTYGNVARPKFLNAAQISETYDNFRTMLAFMARMSIPYPKEPFADVGKILSDALDDLLQGPSIGPGTSTGGCSVEDIFAIGTNPDSRNCFDSFFRQLESYFRQLGEILDWLFETIADLADLLLASLSALSLASALAMLYGIQVGLYDIYQTMRYALVIGGLVYPEPHDLNNSIARNLTTTYQMCTPDLFETYPTQTASNVSHLVCPTLNLESPATMPDFNVPGSELVTPDDFIRPGQFSESAFLSYAMANRPGDTDSSHRRQLRVGNATDLTTWMITFASEGTPGSVYREAIFTDFDLDADRGYFYKAWRGEILADRVLNMDYL